MILIDSDVFILDLFYPTDVRTEANKRFLEHFENRTPIPIMTPEDFVKG